LSAPEECSVPGIRETKWTRAQMQILDFLRSRRLLACQQKQQRTMHWKE